MAKPKPYKYALEPDFNIISYKVTNGNPNNLFDGIRNAENSSTYTNSCYMTNSDYIIIDIKSPCEIWRSGHYYYKGYHGNIRIDKYNPETKTYDVNVLSDHIRTTSNIDHTQWQVLFSTLPAGRYRFYATSVRADSEWYIDRFCHPRFVIYNNEYYIPHETYYDQETKMFTKVTKEEAYASTKWVRLSKDMTIGDETFQVYTKFLDYPVILGYTDVNYLPPNNKVLACYNVNNKELIVGSGDIDISKVIKNIDNYSVNFTKTNDDALFVVFSIDSGKTWLTYDFDNNVFIDINATIPIVNSYNDMTDEQKEQYENAKNIVFENGILADNVRSIDWSLLKDENNALPSKIRFAYVIYKTWYEDENVVNSLKVQFEANGHFESMSDEEYYLDVYEDFIRLESKINNDIIKVNIK